MNNGRILVVDDEPDLLDVCRDSLVRTGSDVVVENSAAQALRKLSAGGFDLALLDIRMPGPDGIDLLKSIRKSWPGMSVVLMTGFPTAETMNESVHHSADGYITKPFTSDQLVATVTRALIRKRIREAKVAPGTAGESSFPGMIGTAPEMKAVHELVRQIAPANIDVLITGESGTGKELVARSIHRLSARSAHRFVPVDCGAIPENLLESELFGHEKGAFTGATSSAIGLMEFAHQGTLFLDEVCELAPMLQVKLLRSLQERQIRHVGGTGLASVDVRVIAATNRDVEGEVRAGRMREDFYYRLNAIQVVTPPLRSRPGDIEPLFHYYMDRATHEAGNPPLKLSDGVIGALNGYPWPGNVRELQNVARRTAVVCTGDTVMPDDLPPAFLTKGPTNGDARSGFFRERDIRLGEFEREYLTRMMRRHLGNVDAAAAEMKLPRGTAYRLIKKHGLKPEEFRK